jgi:hypothetical protein
MTGLAAQAAAEYTRTDDTPARALPGGGAGAGIAGRTAAGSGPRP